MVYSRNEPVDGEQENGCCEGMVSFRNEPQGMEESARKMVQNMVFKE